MIVVRDGVFNVEIFFSISLLTKWMAGESTNKSSLARSSFAISKLSHTIKAQISAKKSSLSAQGATADEEYSNAIIRYRNAMTKPSTSLAPDAPRSPNNVGIASDLKTNHLIDV